MSLIEQEFILELLRKGQRLDGRKPDEVRPAKIAFGSDLGSATVTCGETIVAAQVSAYVRKPRETRPFEGGVHISTELSSMADPKFQNGRSNSEETVLAQTIEKAIRKSNALDQESLCITAGRFCWEIHVAVNVLNYDAGLVDTACTAVMAALAHFKRPDTSIDGDKVIIHPVEERPPVPISVLHFPVCVTYALLPESLMLADATAAERELQLGELIVTMNKDRELCLMSKSGGVPLSKEQLLSCCDRAVNRADLITKLIKKELLADHEKRHRGNLGWYQAEADR